MSKVRSICVYCGSRFGASPRYRALAEAVGGAIAAAGLTLVYGGGQVGLMGVVARAALAAGGRVIGIIPGHLDEIEVSQQGLSELHVVPDMHTRKRMMFDRSDAFLVLPGGLGTLDEFIEVTTWSQLDLHDRPIILLNHEGYWDPLLGLIDHVIREGFAGPESAHLFTVAGSVEEVFKILLVSERPRHAAHPDLF
ncbi:MAG: TIGR00730 family Rossman fold protein [Alphaproteobacteria bacterium]|nr:MAG: TIGR00730 family Rossman fold protein [Alphaproteobacteria bacterium]